MKRKLTSPYQRKGKIPFRYSDAYHAWNADKTAERGLRHQQTLVQRFGRNYWTHPNGKLMFPTEAYQGEQS